jgi:hypothetical protein
MLNGGFAGALDRILVYLVCRPNRDETSSCSRKSRRAWLKAYTCWITAICRQSGMTTSFAPGMQRATASAAMR